MVLHDMGKTAEGRTAVDGDRDLAGEPPEAGALQGDLAAAGAGGGADRRPGARAREGRQGGRLDRRRPARDRDARRAAARPRWSTRWSAATDEETLRFLDDCIILFVHANPDGNDLVADWYMRNADPRAAVAGRPAAALPEVHRPRQQPRLLRLDAGGDREHQPRPLPRVVSADPLQPPPERSGRHGRVVVAAARSLQLQPRSAARSSACRRSARTCTSGWPTEGKPGATMASGGAYDGWWNGGIRNTGNFHNIIAILTETIGSPTPMRDPARRCSGRFPNRDLPYPIAPQEWHFRQSIDYSMSFNRARARLRVAQPREPALQHLQDGAAVDRARQRGLLDAVAVAHQRARREDRRRRPRRRHAGGATRRPGPRCASRSCAIRARYIIPSDQRDFPTAVKFINALREVNVTVHRATRGVPGRRQELSRRLVRRLDEPGVPAARASTCSSRRITRT